MVRGISAARCNRAHKCIYRLCLLTLLITAGLSLLSYTLTAAAQQVPADKEYEAHQALIEGSLYGQENNYSKARQSLLRSAELGNSLGQEMLGLLYFGGKGGAQDYGKAAYWFRKAAEQGHQTSMYVLATMYRNGQGIRQDLALAYALATLATSPSGNIKMDAVQLRSHIAPMLTPEELEQGNNIANSWKQGTPLPLSSADFTNANGATQNSVNNPSFDCSKSRNQVDRTICSDPELSRLDVQMANLYSNKRESAVDSSAKRELRKSQLSWLSYRNSTCSNSSGSVQCLKDLYVQRIQVLSGTIGDTSSNTTSSTKGSGLTTSSLQSTSQTGSEGEEEGLFIDTSEKSVDCNSDSLSSGNTYNGMLQDQKESARERTLVLMLILIGLVFGLPFIGYWWVTRRKKAGVLAKVSPPSVGDSPESSSSQAQQGDILALSEKTNLMVTSNLSTGASSEHRDSSKNRASTKDYFAGVGGCLLGIIGLVISLFYLGIGLAGIENVFGVIGVIVTLIVVFIWRFTLLITIGVFLYATHVWELNGFIALLIACPPLIFMIPGFLAVVLGSLRNRYPRRK